MTPRRRFLREVILAAVGSATWITAFGAPEAASQANGPLRVGLLASLTGPISFIGDPTQRAAKLAIDQVNASGGVNGRKIELISYDTEGNPDKALTFMKKLIGDDKVSVIIGPDLSATVRAALPASEEAGVPVIYLTPIVEPKTPSFSFTNFPSEETSYRVALGALKAHNTKKLSVLATTDLTGESGVKWLTTLAPEFGITLAHVERFDAQDKDVTPQLTNIRASNPDTVFFVGTGSAVAVVCKTYTRLGFKQTLVTSTGAVSGAMPHLLKGIIPDTLIFPTYKVMAADALPADDLNKKAIDALAKIYEPATGKKVDFGAASGWDAAMTVITALREAGEDRTKIRDAIEHIKDLHGAFTTQTYSPQNHRGGGPDAQIMVQLLQEGKFAPYK
jgi:branched-chain amino acid transport system substrate-binding protein